MVSLCTSVRNGVFDLAESLTTIFLPTSWNHPRFLEKHRRAQAARENNVPAIALQLRRMNNNLRTLQDEMDNVQVRMVEMAAGLPQHAYNPVLIAPVQPSAPILQHIAPGCGNI